MIVVWRWNESEVYGLKEADQVDWSVEGDTQGDAFVQIDKDKDSGGITYLTDLIRPKLEMNQIMLFLHNNQKYGYNSDAVKEILEGLGSRAISNLVIRLFTGGTESVYYTPANKLGILGTKGTIPSGISDLATMTIKAEHYDAVWNNYFINMKERIYQLKESFFRRAKAHEICESVSYLDHLSQDKSLWYSMYNFIEDYRRIPKDTTATYSDFSVCINYTKLKGNKHVAVAYKEAQKEMKKSMKSTIIENNEDAQAQTQEIYHQLTNLWKAIPQQSY